MFLQEYGSNVPFKLLLYLTGDINYGGRVTDDLDRRCLMNILSDYYSPFIFNEGYTFDLEGIYYPPSVSLLKEAQEYVHQLPLNDPPSVFGLHENADVTCAQQEVFSLFADVMSLQPRVATGLGMSREDQIGQVVQDIMRRIPTSIPEYAVPTAVDQANSMDIVLSQEIVRYNKLLTVIASSLKEVVKALKGLVVMSLELENLSNSLFNNSVPDMWAAKAYPSLKPLNAWIADLEKRMNFITSWAKNGPPPVYWISGFYFPQAFLTGTLQNYARKYKIPIDTVSFDFKILQEKVTTGPEDGCYITGLFLEGARWDHENMKLGESKPKELYSEMAVIHLSPVVKREKPINGIYNCPVYKTLRRAGTLSTTGHSTNFVLHLELPSSHPQKHWIKRGVALVCALNY
jgi:dynein heavy chain